MDYRQQSNRGFQGKCYHCGRDGHKARDCKAKQPTNNSVNQTTSKLGYVDTHCHLDYIFQKLKVETWDHFLQKNDVGRLDGLVSVFCDPAAFAPSLATWQEQLLVPTIYGIFGIHPHNAKYYNDGLEERIVECLKHPKAVAWGEIGLDFVKNVSPADVQINVFRRQAKKAAELGKPVVIHSRHAEKETLQILKECFPKDYKIHVHCFGESADHAKQLMTEFPNLFIGLTGSITFSNSDSLRFAVQSIPIERILLETDGPYMAPAPLPKGTVAHPGHIPLIAQYIANVKQIDLDTLLLQVRKNTTMMYGF